MSDSEFYHEALVHRLRDRDDCDDDIRGACDEIEECYESIKRIEAEVARLRDELASATRHMEMAEAAWLRETAGNSPVAVTLTDEEREAVEAAIDVLEEEDQWHAAGEARIKTLRKLLARLA